ncbi:uncharacterized protein LOC120006405 [Tripterygium wilfordii]|uniref:uncharacterized protein LOC120006405 n=1 Tax=Tripterygium wilfordii TaxID=458696 RepID=UPI0018F7FF5F|nr:uncharacterized protein LOC120006405 [Tripterygium wilfordii]
MQARTMDVYISGPSFGAIFEGLRKKGSEDGVDSMEEALKDCSVAFSFIVSDALVLLFQFYCFCCFQFYCFTRQSLNDALVYLFLFLSSCFFALIAQKKLQF